MKPTLVFILICAGAWIVFGQDKALPEYGNTSDLKGMTKVYIVAGSSEQRNAMLGALKTSTLIVVDSPDKADFFLEHKVLEDRTPRMSLVKVFATELTAYTVTGGHHRIAWSKTKKQQWKLNDASLVKDFLKDIKKH